MLAAATDSALERNHRPGDGRPVTALRWLVGTAATIAVFAVLVLVVTYAALPLLGYETRAVVGGSMEPSISRGSLAVLERVHPGEIEEGDIITFRYAEGNVDTTHRVVGIRDVEGRPSFTTRGDANTEADAVEVRLSGDAKRVVYAVPHAGRALEFVRGTSGLLVFIVAPALGVMALWIAGGEQRRKQDQRDAGPSPAL
jgi:signal peptidase I